MRNRWLALVASWLCLLPMVAQQNYRPEGRAFVCENGNNRYTRALYGGPTDYRIETSDRPVFAIAKKGHHRHVAFKVNGIDLENAAYCKAWYVDGMRSYRLRDKRLGKTDVLVDVVALHNREGVVWRLMSGDNSLDVTCTLSGVKQPKLHRNGDLGVDRRDCFDAAQNDADRQVVKCPNSSPVYVVVMLDKVVNMSPDQQAQLFAEAVAYNQKMASRVTFDTPDPYINTLGGALVMAADGDWDGQTWLHGCVGWRMPLAGWRAGYLGDVLGWNDRARSHFDAYARSQVNKVSATQSHPAQDEKQHLARAEKRWGTPMYSNGYICRNPNRNDQMHHYDMNLNYIDELLWHFQYNADIAYIRKMWPVVERHLEWEKRNFDPDGDHLYDAYCCIWASDALYYNGGAVTHSSAYNYRANLLAARMAELIGRDPKPYQQEAAAILDAMNSRLWLEDKGHWAEYEDLMGLKRKHESAAVWSIYTPIDCGACSPEQAYRATRYVDHAIPHIPVRGDYATIATTNWQPYDWSINNVAAAEVMHTALAYYQAGRTDAAYRLMMGNIIDQMYEGQSPANFGQISKYDAARGECYRDFGDCIGISSRTLLQGLFGIQPQALFGKCIIRPGFPSSWDHASVNTPYLSYTYRRMGRKVMIEVDQHFSKPLKIVMRVNMGGGLYRDVEGTTEQHQVLTVEEPVRLPDVELHEAVTIPDATPIDEPTFDRKFVKQRLTPYYNANVTDIFRQEYRTPRPPYTTLQIPVQGVGEWCHPDYCPEIVDSAFRASIVNDEFVMMGVPFATPAEGQNIVFTSLWDNYPDSVTIPLKGRAAKAWLLMAGSTNHMQSHITNAEIVVHYADGTTDTLPLVNPDNWCPIDQDYYIDGKAFRAPMLRPYRVSLATGTVSRNLGKALHLGGPAQRNIPGGAAQMLCMPLKSHKPLASITLRTCSNDVVVGLMGLTLQ